MTMRDDQMGKTSSLSFLLPAWGTAGCLGCWGRRGGETCCCITRNVLSLCSSWPPV